MSRAQHPAITQVRLADLADADQVGILAERVYRQGGWADEGYSQQLRDGRSRVEQAIVLVATADDAVVGTVTVALPDSPFAEVCRPDEVEVRMLAVDEAARGQGIASLLMAAGETLARDKGFAGVVLSTEPDMHAAHRLYQRRGYVRQPGRDWQVRDFRLLVFRLQL